jgi:hypothetical protein
VLHPIGRNLLVRSPRLTCGDRALRWLSGRNPALGGPCDVWGVKNHAPMNITEVDDVDDALREWARGVYTEEAAVELLIRSGWTRRKSFLDDVVAGRQEPGTHPWVDWENLGQILTGDRDSGILAASGGEQRVLRIAHSLAAGDLGALVPGLDRDVTAMVLAAVAHANGSHEHSGAPTPDSAGRLVETGSGQRFSFALLPSLHPWPSLSRR